MSEAIFTAIHSDLTGGASQDKSSTVRVDAFQYEPKFYIRKILDSEEPRDE